MPSPFSCVLFTCHLALLRLDHLLHHITSYRSVLLGSQVTVVTVCQRHADLACHLIFKTVKCSFCFRYCCSVCRIRHNKLLLTAKQVIFCASQFVVVCYVYSMCIPFHNTLTIPSFSDRFFNPAAFRNRPASAVLYGTSEIRCFINSDSLRPFSDNPPDARPASHVPVFSVPGPLSAACPPLQQPVSVLSSPETHLPA